MMEYKGYQAAVTWDDAAEGFCGRVLGIRDVIFFEAPSRERLEYEFHISIDDYLAFCAERGLPPDKPLSGRVSLRLNPDTHRAATKAAHAAGKSLNAWLSETIEQAVG